MRAILQAGAYLLGYAGILFGAAGRLDWPMAWAVIGLNALFTVASFLVVDPDLLRERSRPGPDFDRRDALLASLGFVWFAPLALLVAGLDARFRWFVPIPLALELGALLVLALGYAFGLWAMRVNRFFSTFVRIQRDRGHVVVSRGPYALVRHPGYSGFIVASLAVPVALGSLYALLPVVVGTALFVLRTAREDATLQRELPGYADYAARVRWRLVPGVW
jgi:protein-S-isoprenylcysteine O-methyltransferase Ste14